MKPKNHRLEVKRYSSPDVDNLWGWQPEGNAVFYLLEMEIGLVSEKSSDLFTVIVATPEGLSGIAESSPLFGEFHRLLLLYSYSWCAVQLAVEEKVSSIRGDGSVVSVELGQYFNWEYEGMK